LICDWGMHFIFIIILIFHFKHTKAYCFGKKIALLLSSCNY
jgi:hypothetical protein